MWNAKLEIVWRPGINELAGTDLLFGSMPNDCLKWTMMASKENEGILIRDSVVIRRYIACLRVGKGRLEEV